MALKTNIQGMVHHYPDYFEVGREQVRAYASAVKATDPASFNEKAAAELGHDGLVAPLTFPSIFAMLIQQDFFRTVDVGMETLQIVVVDQKFQYHRPIKPGDRLFGRMDITSVDERFGADIVVTKSTCTNENGEVVLEASTTLMGHEGDDSISIKWDPESGQIMRKAAGE